MPLLLRDTRVAKRFARGFIESDTNDGDGGTMVSVAGGQYFFPLGMTSYT